MKYVSGNAAALVAGCILFGAPGVLSAQSGSSHGIPPMGPPHLKKSTADLKFTQEAAQGALFEIESGKLAVQKGSNARVREYGQRMIESTGKMKSELESVAARDDIPIPHKPDPAQQTLMDNFSRLAGTAFDRAYMQNQIRNQEQDIAEFRLEVKDGENPDLKDFAKRNVAVIESNLNVAMQTERELGVTSRK